MSQQKNESTLLLNHKQTYKCIYKQGRVKKFWRSVVQTEKRASYFWFTADYIYIYIYAFKRTDHSKMKILLFTHSQDITNLHKFFSSAEYKIRYFEECW